MSSKDILLTCIWTSDGFVVVDKKTKPSQDEAYLIISEKDGSINVNIPKSFSLITKKIIERRVQSIAKSGFAIPNSSLRIGGGFKIEVMKHEEIPSVLLQEGHKYSYDEFSPPKEVTTIVEETITKTESEYIPSFLKLEGKESEFGTVSPKTEDSQETLIIDRETKVSSDQGFSDVLAGRFIIALSEYGDIFFNRQGPIYSVDFSHGKVIFRIENERIVIDQTERIQENDDCLREAVSIAEKQL